jgi:hypothetical protein
MTGIALILSPALRPGQCQDLGLDLVVSFGCRQALRRLARYRGVTIRQVVEAIVASEEKSVEATMDDEAFESYIDVVTR